MTSLKMGFVKRGTTMRVHMSEENNRHDGSMAYKLGYDAYPFGKNPFCDVIENTNYRLFQGGYRDAKFDSLRNICKEKAVGVKRTWFIKGAYTQFSATVDFWHVIDRTSVEPEAREFVLEFCKDLEDNKDARNIWVEDVKQIA